VSIIDRLIAPESSFQKRFFFLAKRFVPGETIDSALAAVRQLNDAGMSATLDFLGEDVFERSAADHLVQVYLEMLDKIRASGLDTNVSVKLSAMGMLIDDDYALANLELILDRASANRDPFVRIDMEGSAVTQKTLDIFERAFATRKNVGEVLQAYLKRTAADVERAVEIGARVRICKGAYEEPAEIAIKAMPEIREAYKRDAFALMTRGNYPGIATHDVGLIDDIKAFAKASGIGPERFEFQMLYGCRPHVQRQLVAEGYRVRVYVPFGTHWAGYFYRRVLERRENLWFAISSMFQK
jgi:proline dehydrogenase